MLGYPDTIRVSRSSSSAAAANTGWADADGAETAVYAGRADVQDGAQTLQQIAGDAGERSDATAVVFFPPEAADAFAAVKLADDIETPIGNGTVVGVSQTDASLAVRLTRSEPSAPTIL